MTGGGSVRRRLLTAMAVSLVLMLASVLGGLAAVTKTASSVDELVHRVQPMQLANAELRAALSEASRGVRGYLLTGERQFLEAYERGQREYPPALARVRALQRGGGERELVDRQDRQAQAWFALNRPLIAAGEPVPTPAQSEPTLQQGRQLLDDLLVANDELSTWLGARQRDLEARAGRVRTLLAGALSGLGLLGLALVARSGRGAARAVTGPLEELRGTLARLAAGEHGARAAVCPSAPAEIRSVAEKVNALADESDRLRRLDQDRASMQRLAHRIGRAVREDLDGQGAVEQATAAVGQALDADRVYLRLVQGHRVGQVEREWTASGVKPILGEGWQFAETSVDWVRGLHETGRPFVVPDTASEPALQTPEGRKVLDSTGAAAMVAVPIAAGGEVFGLLSVAQVRRRRDWTGPEVELVQSVATDLARGLRHAQLYAQQLALVQQLRELDRAKTEFVSTVSHELRTPLTSQAGYLELLLDGDLGPVPIQQQQALTVIDRNTRRLRALIEDLLTLSRIEAGAYPITAQPVAVADLMAAAIETVAPGAARARVHVTLEPGPPGLLVSGDPGQLERVLLNLLSNAIKFSPPGGAVRATAASIPGSTNGDSEDVQTVALTVADNGIGIPTHDQERVFSRFFRAANATAAAVPGTGLGLVIARSIVERHGGSLHLNSTEGVGTTVEIRLPRLQDAQARGDAVAAGSGGTRS